ncbi:flagellar hook-basal body complex protein [Caminibacter mediatlanticus]|uniref:Flagellar hook protein FlgE n=1 Tax=Caminibacter mediatlanticus TB-2 TaxID=391592 RepID=A0AAI9AGD2_9BACT|nr:flagellar hook-basal body complex protein [Caminibacter mediatlanticus]EDM23017.1 flagellar hook protein [Caminibacter mediatlanticus TB-2]
MTTSFYNGVSGLISFQNGLDIWGDNIANINTPGFKESIPEFATIFSQTLSNASPTSDIGLGSLLHSTAKDMSIGNIVDSDNPFDIAIADEKGFLGVSYNGETFYTRNGNFTRDANGFLVNDSGAYLLVANANNLIKTENGYIVNRDINTDNLLPTNTFSPISLPNNVILPAIPTKNVSLSTNLNNDSQITTTKPVTNDISFSAMYDKDGNDMQIVNGQNLLFGFGNDVTYNNGLLTSTFCINDDIKDGKDVNIDFTLNGKEIKLNLPDGATKETISKEIANQLNSNGFIATANNGELTISTTNEFLLESNNEILPSTNAAILTYKDTPEDEFDFNNMEDFINKLQTLALNTYGDIVNVSLDNNGRVAIENTSNSTLNSYLYSTNNSNENFIKNLGRVGNQIYPNTANKSYEFLANSQDFGGYVIDSNGDKIPVTINFTKKSVLNNTTIWKGTISINTPTQNITTTQDFTFDSNGFLLSPKEISFNNINFRFNISSFAKTDTNATNYSFNQDGVEEGFLQNYQIDENGKIIGIFSNNQDITFGQIPIFHFQNPQGLENIGSNLFRETSNSNKAFLYTNENGSYIGKLLPSKLETSNVNMSQAMTELIVTQKAFQASAKTVTTSDEMIQKAINLKR